MYELEWLEAGDDLGLLPFEEELIATLRKRGRDGTTEEAENLPGQEHADEG